MFRLYMLVLSSTEFKRLAKILLKHKHLDNEGKLELLHMMSNVMSKNKIGLHNAQGKMKCQMKN